MIAFPNTFSRGDVGAMTGHLVLEIGPFVMPILSGPNVKYFDIMDRASLLERAAIFDIPTDLAVDIDFVSPFGDISVVDEHFEGCVSSHNIEHQPDIIGHLQSIESILLSGGCYVLFVPDKRYCFDHFINESTIAEILDAQGRKRHTLRSVIEHRAFVTHNDTARHWIGDHGAPLMAVNPAVLSQAINEFEATNAGYIDVHAWQFTPESFEANINALKALNLTNFMIERLDHAKRGQNEFCAILRLPS